MADRGSGDHANERRTLWIYPWDLLDAGVEATVGRAHREWGLTSLSLASSYHSAKFLLPRRASERVFLAGGAAVYFRPDPSLYADTPLRPVPTDRTELLDVLDRTAEACRRQGLGLRAWTVGLHNSRLGEAHPDAAQENLWGDRYPWALCPANPDVRRYLVALVRDLATNHDLDAIDLESAGYHGLAHGHHHELTGVAWGPVEEFVLGLCFCRHCLARAGEAGVDAERLRAGCRALVEARLAEEASIPPADPADAREVFSLLLGWPDLWRFVRTRLETVTDLVAEVQRDALAGLPTALALTAATFVKPAAAAWREGMDLGALARVADELILLSYFPDPGQVAADVRSARELVVTPSGLDDGAGAMERLVVGLSLLAPATADGPNLRAKVEAARALGARKFSFYNFGFVSETRLGWLGGL